MLWRLVFLLGFIILRENPRYRLNRIVALMLFFGGLGAIFSETVRRYADLAGVGLIQPVELAHQRALARAVLA